jgi:propanediol dehydratase small subunit
MSKKTVKAKAKEYRPKVVKVKSPLVNEILGDVWQRKLTYQQIKHLGDLGSTEGKDVMPYQISYGIVDDTGKPIFDVHSEEDQEIISNLPGDMMMELYEEMDKYNSPQEANLKKN